MTKPITTPPNGFIPPGLGGGQPGPGNEPPGAACFVKGTRITVPLETLRAIIARMEARANLAPEERERLANYRAQVTTNE